MLQSPVNVYAKNTLGQPIAAYATRPRWALNQFFWGLLHPTIATNWPTLIAPWMPKSLSKIIWQSASLGRTAEAKLLIARFRHSLTSIVETGVLIWTAVPTPIVILGHDWYKSNGMVKQAALSEIHQAFCVLYASHLTAAMIFDAKLKRSTNHKSLEPLIGIIGWYTLAIVVICHQTHRG